MDFNTVSTLKEQGFPQPERDKPNTEWFNEYQKKFVITVDNGVTAGANDVYIPTPAEVEQWEKEHAGTEPE